MLRRHLVFVTIPLAALMTVPLGAFSAEGAVHSQATSSAATAQHASSASSSASARKSKKARTARAARATTSFVGLTNAVRVSWHAAPNATRYRVKWAYAPWDKWPRATHYSSWLPASARSQTMRVSTDAPHDSTMSATPYANPVFVRVQTANGSQLGPWSTWRAAWPRVARPSSGRTVRLGTYNVMLAGRSHWTKRMPRIAKNIASHGVGVALLQETMNTNGRGVAARLSRLTHHTWRVAPSGKSEGRILFDSNRYALKGSGLLNDHSPSNQKIFSYRTGRVIPLPWARFRLAGSGKTFVVTSIDFAPSGCQRDSDGEEQQADRCERTCGRGSPEPDAPGGSEPAVIAATSRAVTAVGVTTTPRSPRSSATAGGTPWPR